MTAVPQVAIDLAKRFEGFCRVPRNDPGRAYPYICPAGFWTIGYGHLCDQSHPPIVVVGTSWGGLVAGEFALAQPKRILGLVMLNTPVIKAPNSPSLSDRFVVWGARWIHSTAAYRNGVAKAFFLPATIERGGIVQEDFHHHLRQADGAALSQAIRSVLIDREPLADRMNGIRAPTLFVAGRRDAMYPVDALQRAASAVHGAATLRSGRVPGALISIPELANEVAERVIRAMKHE